MTRPLHVVVLEPYYGGSHAAFVDTLAAHSRHNVTIVTLPARKWKWRMRGASLWFVREGGAWMSPDDGRSIDVILTSDMLSVTDLKALLPDHLRGVPIACYFHENQLTYPIPDERERDYQYAMTNITSCLAADAVWFNSRFHLEEFLAAASRLLAKMPDHVPSKIVRDIRRRADVLPPPVSVQPVALDSRPVNNPPVILWCHRWEYDKNPEPFFDALIRLDEAGHAFDLALVGEQFRTAPPVFADTWDRLQPHIIHAGYLPNRSEYLALISRCDLVVSTAIQENFGIAVLEAILSGCQPLLPNRLAYPEILPEPFHEACLFESDEHVFERLKAFLEGSGRLDRGAMAELQAETATRFGVEAGVSRIDDAIAGLQNPSRAH